ncbi:MAG: hypothetical protein AAGH90_04340 [Pseudomonadota bacterium]
MRSFLAILAAGVLALLAVLLMPTSAQAQVGSIGQQYALKITLEENGEVLDQPKIVVEQGKNYLVSLTGRSEYDFRVSIPADTRAAAQDQFDRDLGRHAANFMVINSLLSFENADLPADIPEEAREVPSSILLLKTGRPIRSNIPMETRGLTAKSGAKIESLAITIEATPFR